MRLSVIGSNQTLLYLKDGTVVLYSYKTPVAAYIPGKAYVRTSTHYSLTTQRHIQGWVKDCDIVEQEFLDNLVSGAG
jgi:hypothetical protein